MNAESITQAGANELVSTAPKPEVPAPSSLVQQVYQCISIAALAVLSYFFISHYVVQSVRVVGVSMVPTLEDSQQYLLNKWVYHFRDPRINDVVVLRDPVDGEFAVKRVIAVANDQVELKGGNVYVNGKKLDEPYLSPGMPTFPYAKPLDRPITLHKGEFFVLGDNRKNSADSRLYGPVQRGSILGMIAK